MSIIIINIIAIIRQFSEIHLKANKNTRNSISLWINIVCLCNAALYTQHFNKGTFISSQVNRMYFLDHCHVWASRICACIQSRKWINSSGENYVGLEILFEACSERSHQIIILSGARKWWQSVISSIGQNFIKLCHGRPNTSKQKERGEKKMMDVLFHSRKWKTHISSHRGNKECEGRRHS